jgi:hypothetical protein
MAVLVPQTLVAVEVVVDTIIVLQVKTLAMEAMAHLE